MSRDPENTDIAALNASDLAAWAKSGSYTRVIVHERGYFLVDPSRGTTLYLAAVRRIADAIGATAVEVVELTKGDPTHPEVGVPVAGDLVPWTSQPAEMPPERAPAKYRMAIIDIPTAPGPALDSAPEPVD
jgi:hypothetical protein